MTGSDNNQQSDMMNQDNQGTPEQVTDNQRGSISSTQKKEFDQ